MYFTADITYLIIGCCMEWCVYPIAGLKSEVSVMEDSGPLGLWTRVPTSEIGKLVWMGEGGVDSGICVREGARDRRYWRWGVGRRVFWGEKGDEKALLGLPPSNGPRNMCGATARTRSGK